MARVSVAQPSAYLSRSLWGELMPHEGENTSQRNRRFLARYGATILRGGIATIPTALYSYQGELGLKPQHVWFISAVLAHKWDEDMPKPSLKRMAVQVGVSERHLHNLKDELQATGYLDVVNRHNTRGGQQSNYYDFSGLFGALEERLRRDKPRSDEEGSDDDEEDDRPAARPDIENPPGRAVRGLNPSSARGLNPSLAGGLTASSALKEAVKQEAEGEEPTIYSNAARINALHKELSTFESKQIVRKRNKSPDTTSAPAAADIPDRSAAPTGFAPNGQLLAQRHPLHTAPEGPSSSPGRGRPPKVSERVAVLIEELTHKLHDDPQNVRSNITRAARLRKAAGLSDDAFYHRLHEAKSITQQQGNVTKPATDGHGVLNRMPYFFAVVEDLVGLKEQP
jgi:hypothetical protein